MLENFFAWHFILNIEMRKISLNMQIHISINYVVWVLSLFWPCRVGLVVSVSASRTVGREFASRPGHTKDHHKNGTNCLPDWHACVNVGVWQCMQPNCLKGRVVCGTVYGDMHLKDLLGSFVRVGYRIPVPDFYLVLHGIRCRKSTLMD